MWQKLERAVPVPKTKDSELAKKFIKRFEQSGEKLWANEQYTVHERRWPTPFGDAVQLSIHSKDRDAVHDWRDFQKIKNDILGPEQEMVELYPAESRLVDTSNEYHLFGVVGHRLPFGYTERLVSESGYDIGAKQRPWPDDEKPDGLREIIREEIEALADEIAAPL